MKTPKTVLLLPLNYTHVQYGMIQGFNQAFSSNNVTVFDFMCATARPLAGGKNSRSADQVNADFVEYIGQRKPDLVFMQLQDTGVVTADAIIAARATSPATVFVHWTGDYRPIISDYLKSICQATDITFASSVGQLPDFVAAGAHDAMYLQIGLDWDEDVLGLPAWEPPFPVPEVVFCGNHYTNGTWPVGTAQRLEAIQGLVAAGFDVGVVGNGWPPGIPVVGICTPKQQGHIYRHAKVALSISHENGVDRYYSDRLLIAMASGTPVVARRFPGIDEEFGYGSGGDPGDSAGVLLPNFETTDELISLVSELRANEDWREMLGANQRAAVRNSCSWFSRVVEVVLPTVENY